jgi:hypothetical protein
MFERRLAGCAGILIAVALLLPQQVQAIPAFSRMYSTSCSTCHIDFPKLNDFGKAFKDAGFKFPKDDESMIKVPPVMLGAPAQSEIWPKAIWPGKIPGLPPIGFRLNNVFQVLGRNRNNFQFAGQPGAPIDVTDPANFVPRTDFQTGTFSIFSAGNFGSDIAFWIDDDISTAGSGAAGGLGDGYLRFVNVGRFLHLPTDALNLRAGQFELELPFSQARSWNLSDWDIYGQTNIGVQNPNFAGQNVNNGFGMADAAQGLELSGGHHYGGYYYALAVMNQNTHGGVTNAGDQVPAASAFFSDSNFKDVYARLMYRFNLENDQESRHAIQAAGATGPRDHTYLSIGTLYFYGRSVQRFLGTLPGDATTAALLTAREPFYRVGADFSFNVRSFNLFGQYMYGRDHNLLPVDDTGAPVATGPVGFLHGPPATFSGGFLQADYLVYPWMMLIMRYDGVNSRADRINGLANITTNFFAPEHNTRNRITPGIQFLIHANIKAAFEYQFRPSQQIVAGIDPVSGNAVSIRPFRTNSAVVSLDWVY